MPFLSQREPRPLAGEFPASFRPEGLYLGLGAMGLEVAVYTSAKMPTNGDLRSLHQIRVGRRAAPVVSAVLWGHGRAACAASTAGEVKTVTDAEASQLERICEAALAAPDRHAALRVLTSAFQHLTAPIPGLNNSGLFALHELEVGVPRRPDWSAAQIRAKALLRTRGRDLVQKLGFSILTTAGPASILVARERKLAVAVFLERADQIDPLSVQFDHNSPISYALSKADQENLDYVVVSAGASLRVYPVKPGVGTGRRGRTETFLELDLDLLSEAHAGFLWLTASGDALSPGGSFLEILARSSEYAVGLGERLRDRVYEDVVPHLAEGIVKARQLRNPSAQTLRETYQMALEVLFRLLFVAYAEDNELLPLHSSAAYRRHSLKDIGRQLRDAEREGKGFGSEDFYWTEVQQLWKAVDKGNPDWDVPPYNGGLFSSDANVSQAGAALQTLSLPDSDFAPALSRLLTEQTHEDQPGPIDFRALGVREFGTIYEGLLESELSVADTDLTVDKKSGAYLPAKKKDKVVVEKGAVYLQNASGARKASGAYYTKSFAVEHLLDQALEPAISDHLARLQDLPEREAAERFFDFRVADIAMGSGHFLVAAIDRIERRFQNELAARRLPGVVDELERLRQRALNELGENYAGERIEEIKLLRRQIARRCIFGADINAMAVELARLSIWIHTFVPGLPLSFLDANLIVGNSLVGIATFEEARDLLGADTGDLFSMSAEERLAKARPIMEQLGRLADATAAEVTQARELYMEARRRIQPEEDLLTVLTASRINEDIASKVTAGVVSTRSEADVFTDALVRKAERALAGLQPVHFPIVFPQVFLGGRGGFDVIVGNPPWEEATVEEHAFWARHFPGLRGLARGEQGARQAELRRRRPDLVAELDRANEQAAVLRGVLVAGPFPGMGTGDPDVYKAFCWRFWHLASPNGGRFGVVLPRSAFAAKGSTQFRKAILSQAQSISVTMLENARHWVFDGVHAQYLVGLLTVARNVTTQVPSLELRGPYSSQSQYIAAMANKPTRFAGPDVLTWNDSASLPLLPTEESASVFATMRAAPRLETSGKDAWAVRPHSELHATNDAPLMDFAETPPRGYWPVYKGESFDLWKPDLGVYFGWADPRKLEPHLQEKRERAGPRRGSPFSEFPVEWLNDPSTLPCRSPRIAFRDTTNRLNNRTVIACLIPGKVFLANTAPYLLFPRGTEADMAYVLGVLCSVPLDWFARRFVERHLNFFVFNPLPVPRPDQDSTLWKRVVHVAATLAAQDARLAKWAAVLGVATRELPVDEASDLSAELDAAVSHLYRLNETEVRQIFETFGAGDSPLDRLPATLKHYGRLKGIA